MFWGEGRGKGEGRGGESWGRGGGEERVWEGNLNDTEIKGDDHNGKGNDSGKSMHVLGNTALE